MEDWISYLLNIQVLLTLLGVLIICISIFARINTKWFSIELKKYQQIFLAIIGGVLLTLSALPNLTQLIEPNIPVGTIVPYSGSIRSPSDLPNGWLLCDGSKLSDAAAFDKLRNLLKRSFWGKDGDVVYLPDLRGVFLRGIDDPDGPGGREPAGMDKDPEKRVDRRTGQIIGALVGSFQNDAFQNHTHEDIGHRHNYKKGDDKGYGEDSKDRKQYEKGVDESTTLGYADLQGAVQFEAGPVRLSLETRPKNAYVNYLIKY